MNRKKIVWTRKDHRYGFCYINWISIDIFLLPQFVNVNIFHVA